MEYRRFRDTVIMRIDRGEEILEKIRDVSIREGIKLASVSGIGATDDFTVGVYSIPEKKYYSHHFTGVFEIVSLTGNINTMDGEFYSHLHIACGDESGNVVGGHLNRANISATCEIFIHISQGKVDRKKDPLTGINLLSFD